MHGRGRRGGALSAAQAAAAGVVLARLARGRARRPPLAPPARVPYGPPSVSVVIPARDEESRLGPCLEGLAGDPLVGEVIVVDDRSADGTAALARAMGARVVAGAPLPDGWVGKPWALQQGLEAARGAVVVTLDADVRPRPGLVSALVAGLGAPEAAAPVLLTAGTRFRCETAAERLLHPALLATLVVRFGPVDTDPSPPPERLLVNGQVLAAWRAPLIAAGGFTPAAAAMTDDVTLGRALARAGWRVVFRQAGDLAEVRMYESAAETWREWGRSIALPGVSGPGRQAADLAVVWLVLALPVLRALALRPTRLDLALLTLRAGLLAGLAEAYPRRGPAFWCSPLADPLAAVRLTLSVLRPRRVWRGRRYG